MIFSVDQLYSFSFISKGNFDNDLFSEFRIVIGNDKGRGELALVKEKKESNMDARLDGMDYAISGKSGGLAGWQAHIGREPLLQHSVHNSMASPFPSGLVPTSLTFSSFRRCLSQESKF